MIQVTVKQNVLAEIEEKQLGYALMGMVEKGLGVLDDAGCDWLTDDQFNIYIGNKDWCVGRDINFAKLVDAANVLILGHALHVFDD